MKKNYLFGLLFLSPFVVNSQITITSHNVATVDQPQRMSSSNMTSAIDLGTGENYHWDFSMLSATDQNVEEYGKIDGLGMLIKGQFGSFAPVKFRATYYLPNPDLPLQNLPSFLPIQISDLDEFYRLTDDSLSLVGSSIKFNGQGVPIRNTDIETVYYFPLEYGDSYTTKGSFNKDMNPIFDAQWKQKRTRTVNVDGWGKVKTPLGTFQALRIHHVVIEQDSLYASMNGFGTWLPFTVRTGIYEWRTLDEKNPVVRVKTTINGQNETVRSVEFRDNRVLLGTNELTNEEVEIYPNPVKNTMSITTESFINSYQIFSMDGKLIRSGEVYNKSIDCSDLNGGVYLLQLEGDNLSLHTKFVKE